MSFSEYTRIIGRGPTLSRSLTRAEAADAMGMILDGQVAPIQLGGFLLVLRRQGETAEELAGFADAARARLDVPEISTRPDIDWPTYADQHRQQPWFVLAAMLLAEGGLKVLMHGIAGETQDCAPTRPVLRALGVATSPSLQAAANKLERRGIAYAGLEDIAPGVDELFHLKPFLGVRSVANTFARDLNPLGARLTMVGIVHAAYRPTHLEALQILGQEKACVFKGIGGEAQRNPFKTGTVGTLINGELGEDIWPATMPGAPYPWRDEPLEPERAAALWRGEIEHPPAVASIVATAAVALHALDRARTMGDALRYAEDLWLARQRGIQDIAASA